VHVEAAGSGAFHEGEMTDEKWAGAERVTFEVAKQDAAESAPLRPIPRSQHIVVRFQHPSGNKFPGESLTWSFAARIPSTFVDSV